MSLCTEDLYQEESCIAHLHIYVHILNNSLVLMLYDEKREDWFTGDCRLSNNRISTFLSCSHNYIIILLKFLFY